MVLLANTSGALLLVVMRGTVQFLAIMLTLIHAPVLLTALLTKTFHHLWNITFVRQPQTGLARWNGTHGVFWPNGDPLWDGQGCGFSSMCCTVNSPPWFNVVLHSPTTDNIEVRICGDEGIGNEDTPIQFMELYVKQFVK